MLQLQLFRILLKFQGKDLKGCVSAKADKADPLTGEIKQQKTVKFWLLPNMMNCVLESIVTAHLLYDIETKEFKA